MKARIIIPVWGEKYLQRMDDICLPALLAPGNLHHLAKHFDCELVILTESKSFDTVHNLQGIVNAQKYANLKLVPVDDVISHPSYYGWTITQALYLGFTDLGDSAKDVWCLFLCADFILADGSYRALVQKMLAGERLIFAPSYCAVEEEVWPTLISCVSDQGDLSMPKRAMAGLILDHAHFTIRSKIINCQMYQIDRVDQFYYLHDNDTLIGRQLPIAIVAFRPELVPLEPVTFWDYGVVAEVCPTANLCVLGDSDDFLMLELRGRDSMSEQLRLGTMDPEEIAADLSRWTTKDQRDCGEFDLILHRNNLPADVNDGQVALNSYYRQVFKRVALKPRNHRDHYIWSGVEVLHRQWKASNSLMPVGVDESGSAMPPSSQGIGSLLFGILVELFRLPLRRNFGELGRRLFDLVRQIYLRLFGRLPDIGPLHPSYSDVAPVIRKIQSWVESGPKTRVFVVQGGIKGAVAPLLQRKLPGIPMVKFGEVLVGDFKTELMQMAPFDFCLVECARSEFINFRRVYEILRPLMKSGGQVLLFYRTCGTEPVFERDFELIANGLPQKDICKLQLWGSWPASLAQKIWNKAARKVARGTLADMLLLPLLGIAVCTLSALGNFFSSLPQRNGFNPNTTSMVLTVTVR